MLLKRIIIVMFISCLILSVSGCPKQDNKSGNSFRSLHNRVKSNVKKVGKKADRDMRKLEKKLDEDTRE